MVQSIPCSKMKFMKATIKSIFALACALAAVSTVAGCSKAANNAPAEPAPVMTPQQSAEQAQMAKARQADAQREIAARALIQHSSTSQ